MTPTHREVQISAIRLRLVRQTRHNAGVMGRVCGRALLPGLAVLALLSGVGAGASGGPSGTASSCSVGVEGVASGGGVITGGFNGICPSPGAPGDQGFGSTTPLVPGQACSYIADEPLQFRLIGQYNSQHVLIRWIPQFEASPPPVGPSVVPAGWHNLSAYVGGQAQQIYEEAGTNDFYIPYQISGTANKQGRCTGTKQTSPCWGHGAMPGCLYVVPQTVTATIPGTGPIATTFSGYFQTQVKAGTISSLPAARSVVNVPTCFFVQGMNPTPGQSWQYVRIVPVPGDAEGRYVFFVFVATITYDGTVWNFGDGTSSGVVPADNPPLPSECDSGLPAEAYIAHTYTRYDTAGFQVTASQTYSMSIDAYWDDSAGLHSVHLSDTTLPQQTATITIPVYQEEGVPIT
jgi:hypothetical protein